jgi:hypothetical protein
VKIVAATKNNLILFMRLFCDFIYDSFLGFMVVLINCF